MGQVVLFVFNFILYVTLYIRFGVDFFLILFVTLYIRFGINFLKVSLFGVQVQDRVLWRAALENGGYSPQTADAPFSNIRMPQKDG
jgi:hypothetical protein